VVTISGKVINEKTGEGLPGVHVIVDELKMGAVTDGNGNFLIDEIPVGSHTITIRMIGYTTIKKTLILRTLILS
jgi:hypothetical protein